MASNYNCLAFQQNATLTLTTGNAASPSDFVQEATQFMADAAPMATIQLEAGVYNYLYWDADFDIDTVINCVYIERISVADLYTMKVYDATDELNLVLLGEVDQIDDLLYLDISVSPVSKYAVFLETNGSPPSSVTMTAPFFGGTDLAGLSDYKYVNGRSYKYAPSVSFQRTKTTSYAETTNQLSKSFAIPRVKSEHVDYYFNFMHDNAGKLVLFREHEGGSQHNYSLGILAPQDGTRPVDTHDFAFSIEYKNIGAQRIGSLSTFSAPFTPDPFTPTATGFVIYRDITFVNSLSTSSSHPTFTGLVGVVDGVNTVFTTSIGSYDAGTVEIEYRGRGQKDFIETDPSTGVITLTFVPQPNSEGNEVFARYQKTVQI